MNYVVVLRKRSWDKQEAVKECLTEAAAIRHADNFYNTYRCDVVAVIFNNPDTQKYEVPYKVTRRCKHRNVQQELFGKWICNECGEEIVTINIESEVLVESR